MFYRVTKILSLFARTLQLLETELAVRKVENGREREIWRWQESDKVRRGVESRDVG